MNIILRALITLCLINWMAALVFILLFFFI